MNQENIVIKSLWIIIIILSLVLETAISIVIVCFHLSAVVVLFLISIQFFSPPINLFSNQLYSLFSIYFLLAWLDAVYKLFKYDNAIPKSLILWHKDFPDYIKKIPKVLGWRNTFFLLFTLALLTYFLWNYLAQPEGISDKLLSNKESLEKINERILDINNSSQEIENQIKNNEGIYHQLEQNTLKAEAEINVILASIKNNESGENREYKIDKAYRKSFSLRDDIYLKIDEIYKLENKINTNKSSLDDLLKKLNEINKDTKSLCSKVNIENNSECQVVKKNIEQTRQAINESQMIINIFIKTNLPNLKTNSIKLDELKKKLRKSTKKLKELEKLI